MDLENPEDIIIPIAIAMAIRKVSTPLFVAIVKSFSIIASIV